MSEAELQAAVLQLARLLGWRAVHFRPAQDRRGRWATHQAGDDGFPDTILVRTGRVLAVELKSARGRLTPGQLAWLAAFQTAGVEAYVWTPDDWLSGVVERQLRGPWRLHPPAERMPGGWGR